MSNPLAAAAAEAGGTRAPRDSSARLRTLLLAELEHGERELKQARSGYGRPVAVAFAPGERALIALCPAPRELRADPAVVSERGWFVVAAALGAMVGATGLAPARSATELRLEAGDLDGHLTLTLPARRDEEADAADLAAALYEERTTGVDRLRTVAVALPGHVGAGVEDLKPPVGPAHPLKVAEVVARLGSDPAADTGDHDEAVLRLLAPPEASTSAHEDPDPVRRVARRILRRLDGSGKWGGYHTEFTHLSRGFAPGNEQALAAEVGESLIAADLLKVKTSVGQRHVFLNPRRSGEIKALIEDGTVPVQLRLPS